MTNIVKKIEQKKAQKDTRKPGPQLSFFEPVFERKMQAEKAPALDTLAQLSVAKLDREQKPAKSAQFDGFGNLTEASRETLKKRARAKTFTNAFLFKLIDLESPLKDSYWNTFHCTSILMQSGQKITGKYCGNRWCLVCNRIRTAKLIISYREVLERLPDKQFVTLTQGPTVPKIELLGTIRKMKKELRRIQNLVFRFRGAPMEGVCKLECTYNVFADLYHPHFHLVIAREDVAIEVVSEWLKTFPEANRKAQNIKPADSGSIMELFKYFTKIISKGKNRRIYPAALDVIFQAMRGLRVFQSLGIRKDIPEDIEELQAEIYGDMVEQETIWKWEDHDWIDRSTGEVLADYTPSEQFKELLKEFFYAQNQEVF